MPSLPIPLGPTTSSPAFGGDLAVSTIDDVKAVLPLLMHPDDPADVRDAVFNALLQILLEYQRRSTYAALQSDILTATGVQLAQAAADLGIYKQPNDTDSSLRARALLAPSIVTPSAILAAANSILAPFTSVQARYCESISDRTYLRLTGTPEPPRAFLYFSTTTGIPRSPDYPDRLYQNDAAANGGFFCPGREPGNARIFFGSAGRCFVLRVPDISSLDLSVQSVMAEASPASYSPAQSFYVGNGTSATNTDFVRSLGASASGVYASIVAAVNRVKGASVRWVMYADPYLKT